MPIVDIEVVLKPGESVHSGITNKLANELGELFRSPKGGTWVKVHGLAESGYGENDGKEDGIYPVFVSILQSALPLPEELQTEVNQIVSVIAEILNRRPSLIHVILEPDGKGRVAFGGKLVR